MPSINGIGGPGPSNPGGNLARIAKIQSVMARVRLINPFNHMNKSIDTDHIIKDTLRLPSKSATIIVQSPYDPAAKNALRTRIENLVRASDPKTNIKAKAEEYAFNIMKIETVAEDLDMFELMPDPLKERVLDAVLYSVYIAVIEVKSEDSPSANRPDDVNEYYELVLALQKQILETWDKIINELMNK